MVLYDLLVECIRVPFGKREVAEESCFDGECSVIVKCWFVFEAKGAEIPIFEFAGCFDGDEETKTERNICVREAREDWLPVWSKGRSVVASGEGFLKVLFCDVWR